jgi:hypothetical protein
MRSRPRSVPRRSSSWIHARSAGTTALRIGSSTMTSWPLSRKRGGSSISAAMVSCMTSTHLPTSSARPRARSTRMTTRLRAAFVSRMFSTVTHLRQAGLLLASFRGGGGEPAAAAVSATRLPRVASIGHARTWLVQAKTAVHRTPILIAPGGQFRRARDVAYMDEQERRPSAGLAPSELARHGPCAHSERAPGDNCGDLHLSVATRPGVGPRR